MQQVHKRQNDDVVTETEWVMLRDVV